MRASNSLALPQRHKRLINVACSVLLSALLALLCLASIVLSLLCLALALQCQGLLGSKEQINLRRRAALQKRLAGSP